MLDVAIRHEAELRDLFRSIWFNEKYKYWNATNFYEDISLSDSTWVNHQFVSLKDGKVIGYIGYSINRADGDVVYNLNILNFKDELSFTFSKDLGIALRNIFEKFKFRKIVFSVIVGNPIEKTYDKICEKYGGRIIGVKKKHARLIDGEYYDEKFYEIFRDDYERLSFNYGFKRMRTDFK